VEALSVRLSDFKVLSFDCYGTLIDWESGMLAALAGLTDPLGLTPNEILQAHATHEAAQQAQTPTKRYSDVLATVYKRLAEHWGVPASHEDCVAYGRSIGDWPAFPDSVEALSYLKRFYKLVILSNVDNASFEGSKTRLGVTFDAVVTAEDAGSYKPDRRNFDYMLERLQGGLAGKADLLHTAESLFHDHVTANEVGLATCWIHRRHADTGFGATKEPGQMPRIDFRFTSMGEMAEAHRAEMRA
jgi:2-haloalkanoic acid dehalogenase type II